MDALRQGRVEAQFEHLAAACVDSGSPTRWQGVEFMETRLLWAGLVLLAVGAGTGAPCASAAGPVPAEPHGLRVVTGQIPPFVFKQGDALTGFSIDLWNALAQRLKADFSLTELGSFSQSEQLQAVQRGDAEVAMSAITMTAERERQVDFTLPYFDSGLQIIVRSQNHDPFLATIESLLSPAIGQILVAALLIVVLLANVLWLVERRSNPYFQKGYLPGIVEGLWGVMLIIATGEHGDREASSLVKRLIVVFMWLLGVVLIAQFTATVTSSLTVQQLQSSIQGPGDLPGKTIGAVPGSIAADYLTQRGLPYTVVNNAEEGYNLLVQGQRCRPSSTRRQRFNTGPPGVATACSRSSAPSSDRKNTGSPLRREARSASRSTKGCSRCMPTAATKRFYAESLRDHHFFAVVEL